MESIWYSHLNNFLDINNTNRSGTLNSNALIAGVVSWKVSPRYFIPIFSAFHVFKDNPPGSFVMESDMAPGLLLFF